MSEQFEVVVDIPKFPDELITTLEAAELTGYTIHNIHKARQRGALTAVKRGNMLFFRRKDVLEYARRMRRLGKEKYTPKSYRTPDTG